MDNKVSRQSNLSQDTKLVKTSSDSVNSNLKNQNKNGKKRENYSSVSWNSSSAGGSMLSASKNSKSWQGKQKTSDQRQTKTKLGSAGPGASRKASCKMSSCLDCDVESLSNEAVKKQNLAHLLNSKFQLVPRAVSTLHYSSSCRAGGANGYKRHTNYNYYRGQLSKDQYLQANCQFVVKNDGDYAAYLADPDLMVPWESIEQMRIWGSEIGNCPICLHHPVAARMTRCGHIYCWPCILHFLALSDKPSRPCPICDSSIRADDLRSVVTLEQMRFSVGDVIELNLMKRDRYSLQPQPVYQLNSFQGEQERTIPQYKPGEVHVFNKLLACTPADVLNYLLPEERRELEHQFELEKDCPESCFIQQALDMLAIKESSIRDATRDLSDIATGINKLDFAGKASLNDDDCAVSPVMAYSQSQSSEQVDSLTHEDLEEQSYPVGSKKSDDEVFTSEATTSRRIRSPDGLSASSRQPQVKNVFYFYQSSDGQAIYLHPINVQMLVRYHGSLESSPKTIQGRIVEIESLSMSEELRNRMRYLGHVPLWKHFQIVEIVFDNMTMPTEIVAEFKERIDERERKRLRKFREEERRDLEIQRAEEAKWGRSQAQPIMQIDSQIHFPDISPSSFDTTLLSTSASSAQSVQAEEVVPSCSQEKSFAQMLREEPKVIRWPSLNSRPSTSNSQLRTSCSTPSFAARHQDSDEETEDYIPVPDYKQTFSSALSAAMDQAASLKGNCTSTQNVYVAGQSSKKGKKSKPKVLFATGMNFI